MTPMTHEFTPFPKMARLSRDCLVTEKIDGTNATVHIVADTGQPCPSNTVAYVAGFYILAGSRTRWINPAEDNHGFAKWVYENAGELALLGAGTHRGEWWGSGIQRGYGLPKGEKRFSLFNAMRWAEAGAPLGTMGESWDETTRSMVPRMQEHAPTCCHVVPVLYQGIFDTHMIDHTLCHLETGGSVAAPGYDNPEGVVCFHIAGNVGFKKTIRNDDEPKGKKR